MSKIDINGDAAKRLVLSASSFGKDLHAFSNHLSQYAAATVYDDRAESVALMTCHSSKGLEFSAVFMTGMEEGIFPCTMLGRPDVEEERRLFYVGLTRARERVILTSSARRPWACSDDHKPSRFITELPDELLERPAPYKLRPKIKQDPAAQLNLF